MTDSCRLIRRPWRPAIGATKPVRPPPPDFRAVYVQLGWGGVAAHYRTSKHCVARWIEECGGDDLRQERARATGAVVRPDIQSARYRWDVSLGADAAWLKGFGGAYRLRLKPHHQARAKLMADERLGTPQSLRDCYDIARLAIIGGGMAVIDGDAILLSPQRATQIFSERIATTPLRCVQLMATAILASALASQTSIIALPSGASL